MKPKPRQGKKDLIVAALYCKLGLAVMKALLKCYKHPTIKLDEVPTFDNMVIKECGRAAYKFFTSKRTKKWLRKHREEL
jgi:hypothetical protein